MEILNVLTMRYLTITYYNIPF